MMNRGVGSHRWGYSVRRFMFVMRRVEKEPVAPGLALTGPNRGGWKIGER